MFAVATIAQLPSGKFFATTCVISLFSLRVTLGEPAKVAAEVPGAPVSPLSALRPWQPQANLCHPSALPALAAL